MQTYYDTNKKCCFVTNQIADSKFWDSEWEKYKKDIHYPQKTPLNNLYLNLTKKYVPKKSLILEGGCGLGYHSHIFTLFGYNTIALDYAQNTINYLKEVVPHINPTLGELSSLAFENNTFDAYWSFGVIEHFWNGYVQIQNEMYRVLKKDGILFLSFPHMSIIRRLKVKLFKYKQYTSCKEPQGFYQFFLDEKKVILDFESQGFTLIDKKKQGALKGLADEITIFRCGIHSLKKSNFIFRRILRFLIDRYLTFFFSHTIILILKKN